MLPAHFDQQKMKFLKPLQLSANDALPDGYQLFPLADQWAELLPAKVPLRFSFFRYLGFYVAHTKGGKSSVVRGRPAIVCLRVTIQNEDKVIFSDRIHTPFRNGVYYVQEIKLDQPGVHTVSVTVEGAIADQVAPLALTSHVYEFMTLDECDDLQQGPYAPLRSFVLECEQKQNEAALREDKFQDAFLDKKTTPLRRCDAKWWLRAYVEHTLDRGSRAKLHQTATVGRSTHKRKQDQPARSADKKEHDNLFERRRREWKRVRTGDLRMFTTEPLHAGATVTVFSAKELYHQLSQYAQV